MPTIIEAKIILLVLTKENLATCSWLDEIDFDFGIVYLLLLWLAASKDTCLESEFIILHMGKVFNTA